MRHVLLKFVLLLSPAVAVAAPPGHLILNGGGERPRAVMEKFVELAGGKDALIVIVPTASGEPDTGSRYVEEFTRQYGCSRVAVLDVRERLDAERAENVSLVEGAGGVFFTGGDQRRITAALLDTPVGAAIARVHARGAVLGGTSAGTACMSPLMITGEGDFQVITAGNVELARGLGFFTGVIVDQHFIARQRQNRLIAVVLEHPEMVGVGVDEATAVWVRPDGSLRVLGEGSVMVVDARGATVSRLSRRPGQFHDLLGASGLRVHVLLPGQEFALNTRDQTGME